MQTEGGNAEQSTQKIHGTRKWQHPISQFHLLVFSKLEFDTILQQDVHYTTVVWKIFSVKNIFVV